MFSLYRATVPAYQQILGAVAGLLDTAERFCTEKKIAPEELIQARLAPDMLPFAYQVKSTAVHSLGALEGVRTGVFSPDMTKPRDDFAALKSRVVDTRKALEAISPEEVPTTSCAGKACRSVSETSPARFEPGRAADGGRCRTAPGDRAPRDGRLIRHVPGASLQHRHDQSPHP